MDCGIGHDIEPEPEEIDEPDPWADGSLRDGLRGFTGGKS
jgi:hypothetical protein